MHAVGPIGWKQLIHGPIHRVGSQFLFNCSTELPWKTVVSHVNNMMLRPQYSGYGWKFCTEVVRSALSAYNRLIELDADASGGKPLYRPREWRRLERAQESKKDEGGMRTGTEKEGY